MAWVCLSGFGMAGFRLARWQKERQRGGLAEGWMVSGRRLGWVFLLAAVAQLVEHVLGKDEVKGSSPLSSSGLIKVMCWLKS